MGEQYDESMTLSEIKHGLQVQRTILTQLVTIKLWSQNKQAYLFDADFLDELMNTDNVAFSKEIVKHLPYTTFYLDFADNERARKLIGADGIVVLALSEEHEYLYCVLVSRQSQSIHTDMIPISFAGLTDKEYYISKDEWFKKDWKIVDLSFNPIDDDNSKPILSKEGNFLLLQIMTYLSSAEPDVRENPKQHIIYRKPKPGDKIRNVPTELQKWDVGIRFGNSFRKWKATRENVESSVTGSGTTKRPHTRRAHWSHYWYGHGDDKVRRPKWISETMVGIGETVTTIHRVKN